jgi:flavin-dependent dehydrogenase
MRLKSVYRGNVALVGDASGSVDAITGEGMAIAFDCARTLARSLKEGGLASYATARGSYATAQSRQLKRRRLRGRSFP